MHHNEVWGLAQTDASPTLMPLRDAAGRRDRRKALENQACGKGNSKSCACVAALDKNQSGIDMFLAY